MSVAVPDNPPTETAPPHELEAAVASPRRGRIMRIASTVVIA